MPFYIASDGGLSSQQSGASQFFDFLRIHTSRNKGRTFSPRGTPRRRMGYLESCTASGSYDSKYLRERAMEVPGTVLMIDMIGFARRWGNTQTQRSQTGLQACVDSEAGAQ